METPMHFDDLKGELIKCCPTSSGSRNSSVRKQMMFFIDFRKSSFTLRHGNPRKTQDNISSPSMSSDSWGFKKSTSSSRAIRIISNSRTARTRKGDHLATCFKIGSKCSWNTLKLPRQFRKLSNSNSGTRIPSWVLDWSRQVSGYKTNPLWRRNYGFEFILATLCRECG